ncbi:MAG: cysteine desulfurase, partial [Verrucomicrobia bacterium]|nr:cysteine desulfurase [Verrucomicrobiota bacterium]
AAWAGQRKGNHIVVGAVEHPAVLNSVEFLEKHGFTATRVKVDGEGLANPADVRAALTGKTVLVVVQHANPDLGTIQPVADVARVTADAGVPLFVDADASAGWLPLDARKLGVSLMSFSPHRFGGPKGIGVLYRNRRVRLTNLVHGGAQEGGRRAGIENVPAIVGAGVACELAAKELKSRAERAARLQQRMWDGVKKSVPHVKLNGPEPGARRLPNHLNFSTEFTEGEGLMLLLDMQGIAVASGTTCASKELKISPVLQAIGLDHALAQASLIVTLGASNTDADVDAFLEVYPKVAAKLRGMSPQWDEFQRGLVKSCIRTTA